ncbi:hypothetical protein Tco_1117434 [Tanacetum coccineum]
MKHDTYSTSSSSQPNVDNEIIGREFPSIICSFGKKQASLNKLVYVPNSLNDGLPLKEDSNDGNDGNEVSTYGTKDLNMVIVNEANVNSRNDGGSGSKSGEDTSPNVVKNTYQNVEPGTTVGNGGVSFATLLKGDTSQKRVNFHTLVTPAGNGADVVNLKESFSSKEGMESMLENGPSYIRNVPLILTKWSPNADIMIEDVCNILIWGRASYARAIVDLQAHIELKYTIMVDVPKFMGEGYNLRTIRVEYKWTPPRRSYFKQAGVSRQEINNSNLLEALNSIENDDLGMNGGNSKSIDKGSLNVAHGSSSNTPIIDKTDKLKQQLIDGKLRFVDESEVEVVFDETANLMASTSFKGRSNRDYSTNILLEQLRETKL